MKSLHIVKPTTNTIPEWIINVCNQYDGLKIKEINYPIDSSESHLLNILDVINKDEKVKRYIFVPSYYITDISPRKFDTIVKGVVANSNKAVYLSKTPDDEIISKKFIDQYVQVNIK